MKIKMRTLSASPQGVLEPGKEYDLDEKFAKDLVAGGYAVPAKKQAPASAASAAVEPVETAVVEPEAEKAIRRTAPHRAGRTNPGKDTKKKEG
jgi:hypothetical protein